MTQEKKPKTPRQDPDLKELQAIRQLLEKIHDLLLDIHEGRAP